MMREGEEYPYNEKNGLLKGSCTTPPAGTSINSSSEQPDEEIENSANDEKLKDENMPKKAEEV